MWKLALEDMHNYACTKDIEELVQHCNALHNDDKLKLRRLYTQYKDNNGDATAQQLLPLDSKKNDILGQYKSKFGPTGNLRYIRDELLSRREKCPFCGTGEATTLDHYMDKGTYGQLACCRYNMVPSCWYCNWLKNEAERPYSDYVHAYFAPYPDVYFLITDITVKNLNVGFIMRIDKNAIGNTTLANQTESQFQNLDLYARYTKNGSSYIADILSNLKCTNDEEIKLSLAEEANKCEQIFKKNHWKTSIARGLMNSNLITMDVVNHYRKKRYLKVEQGV